jgi:hypothetical protein
MKNVANKSCRENQNTNFILNKFFPRKSSRLSDNVEKCRKTGNREPHSACALHDGKNINLLRVFPLCTLSKQNSLSITLFQKEHQAYTATCLYPQSITIWPSYKATGLCFIESSLSVFLKILKFWHYSVPHSNFSIFFLKVSSNVASGWKYIIIKTKILNPCESMHVNAYT